MADTESGRIRTGIVLRLSAIALRLREDYGVEAYEHECGADSGENPHVTISVEDGPTYYVLTYERPHESWRLSTYEDKGGDCQPTGTFQHLGLGWYQSATAVVLGIARALKLPARTA